MRMGDEQLKIQKIDGFSRIYQAECFPNEFLTMMGKNKGEQARYLRWLYTWLAVLDREGMRALDLSQFEYLRETDNPRLFAIRHPHSQINERYIYIYEAGESAILLTAFMEKSKRDYDFAITRAKNILKELEESDYGTS